VRETFLSSRKCFFFQGREKSLYSFFGWVISASKLPLAVFNKPLGGNKNEKNN